MDQNTKRFLQGLAQKATDAAGDAKSVMQSAGKAVADKYDAARVALELARVKGEQDKIFADIGRAVFFMNAGTYVQNPDGTAPHQTIDGFLIAVEQKQQEIDALCDRAQELNKTRVCKVCKRSCDEDDTFCSVCGAKLED